MAKNIDPELRKIGEYLKLKNDTTFIIPQYQRPYSWGINQCDTLWQDINDYIEKGSEDPYFFGTVIINCKDNDKQLELIDGQQRTTTFLLLLKALLIRINTAILTFKYCREEKNTPSKGFEGYQCTQLCRQINIFLDLK